MKSQGTKYFLKQSIVNTLRRLVVVSLLVAILVSFIGKANAQDENSVNDLQVTFFSPVGTNGSNSGDIVNRFSLNLLAGFNGGVDGTEFSGLYSVISKNVEGVQFSGFGNTVLGSVEGAQFSGFINTVNGDVEGAQFSGFVNINTSDLAGVQAAGFVNVVHGDVDGAQVAGFLNTTTGRVKGAQVAGFLNITRILNGVQIGFINVVDSLESGTPIGFISFVHNGYHTLEFAHTETFDAVASFKTGTQSFYNIFSVAYGHNRGTSLFAYGYGVGTRQRLANRIGLSIEGIAYQVNQDDWYTNALNLHTSLSLSLDYQVASHFAIFGGPSWNVNVSHTQLRDDVIGSFESVVSPYTVFTDTFDGGRTQLEMYPGFQVGLRF